MKTICKDKKHTGIRKKGKIYYVNIQINGKRFERKCGESLSDAIKLRDTLKLSVLTGQYDLLEQKIATTKKIISYKDAVEIYKVERLSQLKSGYCLYKYFTKSIIYFHDTCLTDFNYDTLNKFKVERLTEVKKGTVRNEFSAFTVDELDSGRPRARIDEMGGGAPRVRGLASSAGCCSSLRASPAPVWAWRCSCRP